MCSLKFLRIIGLLLCTTAAASIPAHASAADGPLVLYKFEEGRGSVIHDVSGTGAPLDLKINTIENTHWLPGGGLSVDKPATIIASGSADKIVSAIRKSNAITIEAWIQPAKQMQSGPAHIATFSNGSRKRNFTLGQDNGRYDVRLRSTATNNNGLPSVNSPSGSVTAQLTHIVYTRNSSGITKIFIDGVRQSRTIVSGDLGNWSTRFSFALANEVSGGDPWLGRFYRLAVYNRALVKTEVLNNFNAGAGIRTLSDGPVALYTFKAGSGALVYDRSGVGTPLDLKIDDATKTGWVSGGGLTLNKPTIITGGGSGKIVNAVKASNAITIEAWLKPKNTTQGGPSRIATLSSDTLNRNFTLGQKKASYDVRMRSTTTDTNGKPSLGSPSGTLSTALTHVVYTRDSNGRARLYINGSKQSEATVDGDFGNWDISHELALGNELTGDKPWLGTLYLVAVYDRALNAIDVDENFALGVYRETTANTRPAAGSTIVGSAGSDTGSVIVEPAPQVGSVTLNWSAPVTRSNGTPLSVNEISGYNLYYGVAAGDYQYTISINDPYTLSATVGDLPVGTYYFVVTAYDSSGLESSYSETAAKVAD